MPILTDTKKETIFKAVSETYTEVAQYPEIVFHFPTGRPACEYVGYPVEQLDAIPVTAVESFAGVGYPFAIGAIKKGDHLLDVGSGSGTDVLISSLYSGINRAGFRAGHDRSHSE